MILIGCWFKNLLSFNWFLFYEYLNRKSVVQNHRWFDASKLGKTTQGWLEYTVKYLFLILHENLEFCQDIVCCYVGASDVASKLARTWGRFRHPCKQWEKCKQRLFSLLLFIYCANYGPTNIWFSSSAAGRFKRAVAI